MLGFVLQFAFATPQIAAELIGGGMGLSLAASIDPQSGARSAGAIFRGGDDADLSGHGVSSAMAGAGRAQL
jgi:hypothetical protein